MLYEFSFQSFNQRDQVQAWIYAPAAKPVGITSLSILSIVDSRVADRQL